MARPVSNIKSPQNSARRRYIFHHVMNLKGNLPVLTKSSLFALSKKVKHFLKREPSNYNADIWVIEGMKYHNRKILSWMLWERGHISIQPLNHQATIKISIKEQLCGKFGNQPLNHCFHSFATVKDLPYATTQPIRPPIQFLRKEKRCVNLGS